MKFRENAEKAMQEDVFWHPTQAREPPDNYTPGKAALMRPELASDRS